MYIKNSFKRLVEKRSAASLRCFDVSNIIEEFHLLSMYNDFTTLSLPIAIIPIGIGAVDPTLGNLIRGLMVPQDLATNQEFFIVHVNADGTK